MSNRAFEALPRSACRDSRGFTLIELLIAVTILGILSAVAVPSYIQYMTRTKRTVGKTLLLQVADRQEQFFADNKSYAPDLTTLGYTADKLAVDDKGTTVAADSADRIYVITLSNTSATTFTANAEPQLVQAKRDTDCQTLSLTHAGVRDQTGAGTNCW